jgi:SAM-dependent methyltransferase
MDPYDRDFYEGRHERTRLAAETILGIVRGAIPTIASAVDVGCGVGTWLRVLRDHGLTDVLGIDGEWVTPDSLVIPPECFVRVDLARADLPVGKRFDLVISLEVAEHLPSERADRFVAQLTQLGDFIVFSAAIPGQGGTNHFNEQWPQYWIDLFAGHGFAALDIVRRRIWTDDKIAMHYRQNILLFVRRERLDRVIISGTSDWPEPLPIVHPQLYLNKVRAYQNLTISQSLERLYAAIRRRLGRHLRTRSANQ